jgi:hypothetical protein
MMWHHTQRRRSSFDTRLDEEIDDATHGGPEAVDGSLGGLAQKRLELGEKASFPNEFLIRRTVCGPSAAKLMAESWRIQK